MEPIIQGSCAWRLSLYPPFWLTPMANYNWTTRLNILCSLEEGMPKEKLCWIKRVYPAFISSPVNKHSCWVKDLSSEMVKKKNSGALPERPQQGREVMWQGFGGAGSPLQGWDPGSAVYSRISWVWWEAILYFQLRQFKYLEWLVWDSFGGKGVWNFICFPQIKPLFNIQALSFPFLGGKGTFISRHLFLF